MSEGTIQDKLLSWQPKAVGDISFVTITSGFQTLSFGTKINFFHSEKFLRN